MPEGRGLRAGTGSPRTPSILESGTVVLLSKLQPGSLPREREEINKNCWGEAQICCFPSKKSERFDWLLALSHKPEPSRSAWF